MKIKKKKKRNINIRAPFQWWRELKEREVLESDAEVVLFLLDWRVTLILVRFTQLIHVGFCLNILVSSSLVSTIVIAMVA